MPRPLRYPEEFRRDAVALVRSSPGRTFLGAEDLDGYAARVCRLATPDLAAWVYSGWRGYRMLKRANGHDG